jgi:hypothetical protein
VVDGTLATLETSPLADGLYDIRLAVADTLGLTGSATVRLMVDNHAPFASVTSPAVVKAAEGGDVFTTQGEAHAYFPPHAFDHDATVSIVPLAAADLPPTLPDGASSMDAGFELSWPGATLRRAGTFDVSLGSPTNPIPPAAARRASTTAGGPALYRQSDDGSWRAVGGTPESGGARLTIPLQSPGRYALFSGSTTPAGAEWLSTLSLSPRVFSPTGGFASSDIAISFTMGAPGPATVKIYNRAGRLVRTVAESQSFAAGANLVRWDGRGRDGDVVASGLYLVAVEAQGETRTAALSVVK